eukprot:scaffold16508_cov133-Amphora_coffeaeformis.AAC.2
MIRQPISFTVPYHTIPYLRRPLERARYNALFWQTRTTFQGEFIACRGQEYLDKTQTGLTQQQTRKQKASGIIHPKH